MTLVEELKQREQDRKKAAEAEKAEARQQHADLLAKARDLDDYRAVLAGGNADPEAFEKLMATLGITLADVEADLEAAEKVRGYEAAVIPPEKIQALYDAWAAETAAVDAEQRAALHRFIDALPANTAGTALRTLEVGLNTQNIFANAKPADAIGGGAMAHLSREEDDRRGARLGRCKAAYEDAVNASQAARWHADSVRKNHPRLFGGAEAVEGKA